MRTGKTKRLVWLGSFVLLCAGSAQAEVIEIEPDGTTITYSGPSVSLSSIATCRRAARTAHGKVPPALRAAANRHDIAEALLAAVAWQESHWRQDAVSSKGARGLMQLMPSTAKRLGVDADDSSANAEGGAAYLGQMLHRFDGDVSRALAAYNAGPAAVVHYGGIPPYPETQKYVAAVLDHLADISLMQNPGASR